ncbi:ras-related protein Rab-44 [Anolis carolinensis]|uniref:ras-related protein Rab-44 n=1 Tax=Anolis carolinensis TaxID=28377 RepID=UPI002F2B4BB2
MKQTSARAMDKLRRPVRGRKLGSNRWRQPRSMEGNGQTYLISEEEPFHSEIIEKIQDIFQKHDESKQGFITQEDMQKLEGEVPWHTEELELLFDGLDVDNKGYITIEDFTAGLRHFLSSQTATREHRKRKAASARSPTNLSLVEANLEEQKHFKAFINQLGADNIFEDQSEIWRIWLQLRKDEPDLLGNLKEFLNKMTHLIKEAKHAKETLQFMLEMQVADHNKKVQQLYDEIEQQTERERQRLQYESKTRSQLYSMEMEKVLGIKEQEIQNFLSIQKELETQLLTLREKQHVGNAQTEELKRTNRVLENQLQETIYQLQQTQHRLDKMKGRISQMHKDGRAFNDVTSMSNTDSVSRTRVISIEEDPVANSIGEEPYFPEEPVGQSSLFKELNEAIAAQIKASESHQPQRHNFVVQGQEPMVQIKQSGNSQKRFIQEKIPPKEAPSKSSGPEKRTSEILVGKARLQGEIQHKEGPTRVQGSHLEMKQNNPRVKMPEPMPRRSLMPEAQPLAYSGLKTRVDGDCKEDSLLALEKGVIRLSPEMKMPDKGISETLMKDAAPSDFSSRITLPNVKIGGGSKSSFVSNSQLKNMPEPEMQAQNPEGPKKLLSEHRPDRNMHISGCKKSQDIRTIKDAEEKVKADDRDCQMNVGTKESSKVTKAVSSHPDHLYNVLFVGNTDVGKTSFLCRLQEDSFGGNVTATIGVDYRIKNLFVDDKCFTLQLWDTAGQERYHSLTKQFFRKADGVVLMYDITSEYSFADVKYWLSCIQEGAGNEVIVLLLGNKTDCAAERRVSMEDGEYLAKEYGLSFYECSAASGHNVTDSMIKLVGLLKAHEDQLKQDFLELTVIPKKKSSCCL